MEPNYRPIPGTHYSRFRNVNPPYDEISRRQYDNVKFSYQGWRNSIERSREMRHEEYKRFQRGADEEGLSRNEFERLYTNAMRDDWNKKAHRAFALLLEEIGWRELGADYDVGDTPDKE